MNQIIKVKMEVGTRSWETEIEVEVEESLFVRRNPFNGDNGSFKKKHIDLTEALPLPNHDEEQKNRVCFDNDVLKEHINCDEERFMEVPEQIMSSGVKREDILKTSVSAGLFESISTLSIVTAAANAQVSNSNTVALALTNLIAGLFIVRHNLSGLKKKKPKKGPNNAFVAELHHLLHYTVAVLSFLFFGLVPLLVYTFAFRETDNKDLKIIAAAGASLPCIALLAIEKAHLQKPENWPAYVKTVVCYVSIGVVALGLSYFAGYLLGELIEKHGWFK